MFPVEIPWGNGLLIGNFQGESRIHGEFPGG